MKEVMEWLDRRDERKEKKRNKRKREMKTIFWGKKLNKTRGKYKAGKDRNRYGTGQRVDIWSSKHEPIQIIEND